MGLFGDKLSSLGGTLKNSLAEAKEKTLAAAENVKIMPALSEFADKASNKAADYYAAGKEQAGKIKDKVGEKLSEVDYDSLKRAETYTNKFSEYKDLGTEKITALYRSTFEVDKTTEEMVAGIRDRLPARAKDVDDIFEHCKREAIQRAVSAFCLAPLMTPLDDKLAERYENLSVSYSDLSEYEKASFSGHKNYTDMGGVRKAAYPLGSLENGYNSESPLYPADAQIDHIVSKHAYFNDVLLKMANNDDELTDAINAKANLTFAFYSFNGSKAEHDLMDYIESNGTQDELDKNIYHFTYPKGGEITINKLDAQKRYDEAQEHLRQQRIAAAKEVGMTVASAGMRMAAQQVVGLIVVETIDIFVDEIKDIAGNGKLMDSNGLLANINERRQRISDRLSQRFEERQIWARAKAAGIEGGVAGALAAIPQIIISLLTAVPSFMLAIIRECTLSVVRATRVLLSDDPNKYESMKVVLLGTASAVLGVYVSNVISRAVRAVPLLNVFNSQVTTVLSGLVVTAVPMSAVYAFDRYKSKFTFSLLKRSSAPEAEKSASGDAQPA